MTELSKITANVNVGMNEVVSVFVAQYENGLYDKKATLAEQIRLAKQQLKDIDKQLIKSINPSDHDVSVPGLGLMFKHVETSVQWSALYNGNHAKTIKIQLVLRDDADVRICNHDKYVPIPSSFIEDKARLDSEVQTLSDELVNVLSDIKSVSRKERQIRGKISEMKLAQDGNDGLLANPELLKLIQVS